MKCSKCQFDNPSDSKFCNECGTRIFPSEEIPISQTETLRTPVRELTIGSTFSKRYKVISKLGKGGMGKVYKVIDKKIDEEVALKLLNPEIATDEEMIKRFKNELKFARRISHKNICRMYHLSDVEGIHYITMEYVSGEDLKSTIKRVGPLSPGKAIIIAKQVCEGLAEAHKLGVVHRDLKPQNIMIDREGNVRIMDFGISRSIKAKGITQTGIMIGTPDYMSPEQVEGQETDRFSDIYSLGVILYEMVTGRVPFEGSTPLSIAFKHKTEMPSSPKELNNQISEGFSKVILKCMEKDKEKRYQKAEELLSELINIEKGIPITDKVLPKRKTDRETQKKRFKPLIVPGILLLAAVIIVGGYFSYNQFLKPGKEDTEEKIAAIPEKKPQKKDAVLATSQYGQLEISSNPEGAEIYLDDKREGLTPFKRELTPGTYRIRLKKPPEYRDFTDVLELKAGETLSRNFNLVPVPKSTKPKTPAPKIPKPKATVYTVRISTNPSGADVRIDGNHKGKTPISIDLYKRRNQLKIERGEEWSVVDEPITLEPGSNSFHRDLRRIKYNLSIKTNPPDARVLIGDELFGTTPVNKLASVGENKIKIEKDGYGTIEDTVNIVADTEKTYDLEKLKPGKLVLKASPYAEILLDGRLVGEVPPMMIQEVEPGKHTIEFVATKLNKRFSVEVEIGAGESKEIRMNMATGESKIVKISSLQK